MRSDVVKKSFCLKSLYIILSEIVFAFTCLLLFSTMFCSRVMLQQSWIADMHAHGINEIVDQFKAGFNKLSSSEGSELACTLHRMAGDGLLDGTVTPEPCWRPRVIHAPQGLEHIFAVGRRRLFTSCCLPIFSFLDFTSYVRVP